MHLQRDTVGGWQGAQLKVPYLRYMKLLCLRLPSSFITAQQLQTAPDSGTVQSCEWLQIGCRKSRQPVVFVWLLHHLLEVS
jgi:hypothetical protein